VHYLALTFKHAVEFSSFGCTPRICLATLAWGNSTYFIRVFLRSQIRFPDPFSGISRSLVASAIRSRQPVLLYSVPHPESNPGFSSEPLLPGLHAIAFRLRGNLPYLTRLAVEVNFPRSRSQPRHDVHGSSSPVVVFQSAQDQRLAWLWWVSSQVGRCSESPPCRVPHPSRLREHYACGSWESNPPGCDRAHSATTGRGTPHRLFAYPVG